MPDIEYPLPSSDFLRPDEVFAPATAAERFLMDRLEIARYQIANATVVCDATPGHECSDPICCEGCGDAAMVRFPEVSYGE